jgi:hypothetical protein
MTHTRAWRAFKRTEDCACAFASLVYAGAVLHAWRVLPGTASAKLLWILAAPSLFLGLSFLLPILIGPVRRLLVRYVWMSFKAGFGQSPVSILSGLGMLAFAAVFIYLQVSGVAHGGVYPAGVFAGYAAGIGVLFAQALLVRVLERRPEVRAVIEQEG